jgi:ketosteroid isomerase-like protein
MKRVRLAALGVALLTAFVCVPSRAATADTSGVTALVNAAVASFNKGDGKTWQTLCMSPAYIISNIPPYMFSTTCADWWTAHAASSKKNGFSDEMVTLGKAWQIDVNGDRAYASYPASYSYKQNGKTNKTAGVLTVATQKTASGWLMTGWTWSAH